MNVLVIGSGGREHAICRSFRDSPKIERLYCANGNAGIAEIAECVNIMPDDVGALADFATANAISLTFVGGEVSLAMGIVDEFERRGLNIIGPNREAAQLESSKSFAKDFMARHGIPTAKYVIAHSPGFALLELESGDFGNESTPVVVKADGLAAGKGVVVANNRAEAIAAINEMTALVGTAAAEKIVIEECLVGHEVSLFAFVDGDQFVLMPPTRDHKRIGDGDTGPNTGGMGAVTDASLLSDEQIAEITDIIIRPTLRGCLREGFPFRGILFLGLMMVEAVSSQQSAVSSEENHQLPAAAANRQLDRPMLLEYNVRFGDPETQAILVRLETDLVDICEAMRHSKGDSVSSPTVSEVSALKGLNIKWRPGNSACIVLASKGYPSQPQTGDIIHGLDEAKAIPGVEVFHAGTSFAKDEGGRMKGETSGSDSSFIIHNSSFITNAGRVLGVTATGDDLAAALATAYAAVGKISFDGMQYRRDIGSN